MKEDELLRIIRNEIKARYDGHMVVVRRLESVCEHFTKMIKSVLGNKIDMKVYIFPADQLNNPNQHLVNFMRQQSSGVTFACEFVLESPKFYQNICIHTIPNILWLKGEAERAVLIESISETLKTNKRIHDTISYMNSDGFEHLWKDPIAEANKKVILASERRIDDENKGEGWKGGV